VSRYDFAISAYRAAAGEPSGAWGDQPTFGFTCLACAPVVRALLGRGLGHAVRSGSCSDRRHMPIMAGGYAYPADFPAARRVAAITPDPRRPPPTGPAAEFAGLHRWNLHQLRHSMLTHEVGNGHQHAHPARPLPAWLRPLPRALRLGWPRSRSRCCPFPVPGAAGGCAYPETAQLNDILIDSRLLRRPGQPRKATPGACG
jgi:hypothetical protein